MIDQSLLSILERSRSLFERLHRHSAHIDTTCNNTTFEEVQCVDDRLDRWAKVVAQDNWSNFLKRLNWEDIDIETARQLFKAPFSTSLNSGNIPKWIHTLDAIIEAAKCSYNGLIKKRRFIPKDSLPADLNTSEHFLAFEDIMLPFLFAAKQKLLKRLGSPTFSSRYLPLNIISEHAYWNLEHGLLERLINICGKTLMFEFSHFRPAGYGLWGLIMGEESKKTSKSYYDDFVQQLLQDGLFSFFEKYAVLARLAANTIDFWVESTAEFLERLERDLPKIVATFAIEDKSEAIKIIQLQPNLSDPHKNGRTVIAITFSTGLQLVYKPKNLDIEVAYNNFLNQLNQFKILLPFKVLKVLNRDTYGWVEYVEQQPCKEEAEVKRFYERAGILLCITYVLRGIDCHLQNIIASGEHLVLVDLETLFHHEVNSIADPEELSVGSSLNQQIIDSVLRTGLLPQWEFDEDNNTTYDVSGLGSIDVDQALKRSLQWNFINTDYMNQIYEKTVLPFNKNVVTVQGVVHSPEEYIENLLAGFEKMYRFLMEQKKFLLQDDESIKLFKDKSVRFIFRATHIYGKILQNALDPEFLKDGLDFSIQLDVLSRPFLWFHNKPKAWPILKAECEALEQQDIPYFEACSTNDSLNLDRPDSIDNFFVKSSFDQALDKIDNLTERDLSMQKAIIQGAFYSKVTRNIKSEKIIASFDQDLNLSNVEKDYKLSNDQLLRSAHDIAVEIRDRAIITPDNSTYWIGLTFIPRAKRYQLQLLHDSLFDGSCGIGLFLSALDYIRNTNDFRHIISGALHPLQMFLMNADPKALKMFAAQIGIGGATGIGSLAYAFVKIGKFLNKTSLLEDATRLSDLITTELIASDQQFDVMNGAAGAILGLLTLYSETKDPVALNKAIECGQHLLKYRTSISNLPRAWKTFDGKLLTGFSHGASGISYALMRLYAATVNNDYREAAIESIHYERALFSREYSNWPDFRFCNGKDDRPSFSAMSWCHGAPGIGLARLGALSILDTEEIREDIQIALKTTEDYDVEDVDHLCCGQFGRIEVMLVAAKKLSRPDLQEKAGKKGALIVERARQTGVYRLIPDLLEVMSVNSALCPAFFQGSAGIGYQLLRLAYPDRLPSVLLWE